MPNLEDYENAAKTPLALRTPEQVRLAAQGIRDGIGNCRNLAHDAEREARIHGTGR